MDPQCTFNSPEIEIKIAEISEISFQSYAICYDNLIYWPFLAPGHYIIFRRPEKFANLSEHMLFHFSHPDLNALWARLATTLRA